MCFYNGPASLDLKIQGKGFIHPFFHLLICCFFFVLFFTHVIIRTYQVHVFMKKMSHAGPEEE